MRGVALWCPRALLLASGPRRGGSGPAGGVACVQSASENLAAANSRIRDVDVAEESSRLTRSQILMQAGVSVLAQANQLPQVALKLLG